LDPLNELPKRAATHELDDVAQGAFEAALGTALFFVQQKDRRDYGTDYQLEAQSGGQTTNLRVHVQLKGTDRDATAEGTLSVVVDRTNLNYLLAQPHSIYVYFHRPSGRLLARYATDVFQEYERRGTPWQHQDTITVLFAEPFDKPFQLRLRDVVVAGGRTARDERLDWLTTPPERLSESLKQAVPRIEIPTDVTAAKALLRILYEEGQDAVISKAFEGFAAVLGRSSVALLPAYMAEINLGVNGHVVDQQRVQAGIESMQAIEHSGEYHWGSLLYSQGNGWLALEEYEKARETYLAALVELDGSRWGAIEARCSKNLGTVMHHLGAEEAARALYERALELEPDLPEGHFALGLELLRSGEDLESAIEHLDLVITSGGRAKIPSSAAAGWKVEALFRAGRHVEAFGLVNVLISEAKDFAWIWPWLAKQVAVHGRSSPEMTRKSIRFWRAYLSDHPAHDAARRESLLCHFALHMAGSGELDFGSFRTLAVTLIEDGVADPAFLWDRVGHWAQKNGEWIDAEEAFRTAWQLEPSRYGYCLGTALNFLGRFDEALPILQHEGDRLQPDAMSWFQVGVAYDGLEKWSDAIEAFNRAVALDDTYAFAWFNLGGAYWNAGEILAAFETWEAAVSRFPDHELASRVRKDFLGDGPLDPSSDTL
jgi:tetratricopeptide (TPR) repeat protein